MKTSELSWKTNDGINIYAKTWQPENDSIKAAITLVHGMGEHVGRYEHVAQALIDAGFAILGYDHRGHGKSGGPRGHIPSYEQFLDDVTIALDQTKKQFTSVPHFIYGHSMGGGLVANYLIRRQPQLQAALLTGPYFRLKLKQPAIKLALGRFTENLLPKLTLPTGLSADHVSRDSEVVRKYKNDPLVHDKISAKMGISLIDAGEYAIAHAAELKVPTLVMHGTGDLLTDPDASAEFVKNAGSIAQLKLYQGLYHEIHNEPEKEEVFKDMIQWWNNHLKG